MYNCHRYNSDLTNAKHMHCLTCQVAIYRAWCACAKLPILYLDHLS